MEGLYILLNGGEGGIRTHGDASATTVFETAAIDHSATSPYQLYILFIANIPN